MNTFAAPARRALAVALAVALGILGATTPALAPGASATESSSGGIAGDVSLGSPDGPVGAALPVALYYWTADPIPDDFDTPLATTTTDSTGTYAFADLLPGTYQVIAGPSADGSYAHGYIDEISVSSGATAAASTWLPTAASVSGVVVSPGEAAAPVPGLQLYVYPHPVNRRPLISVTTDSAGGFTLPGLSPGDYDVYALQAGSDGLASTFTVTAGEVKTDLELQLRAPASISGRVTSSSDFGVGLAGIQVLRNGESTTTAADGSWSLSGDQLGSYIVRFSDPSGRYLTQWWDGATTENQAKTVRLTSGQQLTGIDAHLVLGASISGRVVSAVGSKPYIGVAVGAGGLRTTTDAEGRYTLGPLPAGTYDVYFDPDRSHVGTTVRGVTVRTGSATTGVDVTLNRTASIVGTVSIENPTTIDPTQVKVQLTPTVRWTRPDANGDYRFDFLGAGSYQIRFIPEDGNAYFTTWWKDALRVEDATNIELALNQEPEVIDAVIPHRTRPDTERVSGADRYAVSANVAQQAFQGGPAGVVYVATGEGFADALSAGSAAVVQGGPLLLTQRNQLPASVKAQITRLAPKTIVVVGGPNSVSASVITQLKALQPNTVRIGGADRYDASRSLARYVFGESGAEVAYIATGANFPDALAASGVAGDNSAPVILVDGGAGALDAATTTLLNDLGVDRIVIAGGTGSVSAGVEKSLKAIAPVDRQAGANR